LGGRQQYGGYAQVVVVPVVVVPVVPVVVIPPEPELAGPSSNTCQVPPKLWMPWPVAALLRVSPEYLYSGWPASVSWRKPRRCQTPSLPLIPGAFDRFLAERTLTGGQNERHPLEALHFGWLGASPLSSYTA